MKRFQTFKLIWVFYFVYYLLYGAVVNRELPNYLGTVDQWTVISLLLVYALLMAFERLISRYIPKFIYFYFAVQLVIISWLVLIPNDPADQDYFMNLVLPLCGQAIWDMDKRISRFFVMFFCAYSFTTMVLYYPLSDGVSFGLTYVTGCILVSVLSSATIGSIKAQQKSQELLEELTIANQKLKEYSIQVERLAVSEERNRLARELHDSVTQIIFSLTLSAQAARILINRDQARAVAELDHLQVLAQSALTEMRSLIQELHPHSSMEGGLLHSLRRLVTERRANDGLSIEMDIKGKSPLTADIENELFRITQEALNNIVKHAHTDKAVITLDIEDPNQVLLEVQDSGVGFDPSQLKSLPGHLGLISMEERVKRLGGTLVVDSQPGKGTRLSVAIGQKQEVLNA